MRHMLKTCASAALLAGLLSGGPAAADDVKLMDGITPRPGDTQVTPENKYKKAGPWKIGMSHFAVNANTWAVQMAREAQAAAKADSRIGSFVLLDAAGDQAKQVADIDDLIAQKVDAIIVTPLSSSSADAGIEKAVAAGIPVIVHTGATDTDAYTVDIQGAGVHFGKVGGDFLVKQLGGKGKIWVLRGLPSHPEDVARYQGLTEALKGTDIKIVAEEAANWQYDDAKQLCETFYLNDPQVDGIWSSGADMTRACMDVFAAHGAKMPPITGEGNNGYFAKWVQSGVPSIAPEFGPEEGAAAVRAAAALLDGKSLHKRYVYETAGWNLEKVKVAYRPDLSDDFWLPTSLSEAELKTFYAKH